MNLLDSLLEADLSPPNTLVGSEQRREVWICIRTDNAPGSGKIDDPYNGSTAERFDNLMNDPTRIKSNMTIRLGPGVFQTEGGDGLSHTGIWKPLPGQKIIGSGIFATTLQLVVVTPPFTELSDRSIIGAVPAVDDFEISDLTLDCNFDRLPIPVPPYFQIMTNAVGVVGKNIVVRRIRAINFGTQWAGRECFPVISIPTTNVVFEDCIVELPHKENIEETTCMHFVGGTNCVMRNNYVNTQFANPTYPAQKVVRIWQDATHVFLMTEWNHCLQINDYILISDSATASLNRRYRIQTFADITADQQFRIIEIDWTGTLTLPDPNVTVKLVGVYRDGFPMKPFLPSLSIVSLTRSGTTATLKTGVPHLRLPDDWIVVAGVVAGPNPINSFNGSFKVTSVTDFELTYTMVSDPGYDGDGEMELDRVSLVDGIRVTGVSLYSSTIYQFTTSKPHSRLPGDFVNINGMSPDQYNGYFQLLPDDLYPVTPTSFYVDLAASPGAVTAYGAVGATFQAMHPGGGGFRNQAVRNNGVDV